MASILKQLHELRNSIDTELDKIAADSISAKQLAELKELVDEQIRLSTMFEKLAP